MRGTGRRGAAPRTSAPGAARDTARTTIRVTGRAGMLNEEPETGGRGTKHDDDPRQGQASHAGRRFRRMGSTTANQRVGGSTNTIRKAPRRPGTPSARPGGALRLVRGRPPHERAVKHERPIRLETTPGRATMRAGPAQRVADPAAGWARRRASRFGMPTVNSCGAEHCAADREGHTDDELTHDEPDGGDPVRTLEDVQLP